MFLVAYLNRVVLAIASGWSVVGDRRCWRLCWLYPLRDLTGFAVWLASFFGRQIVWRGETYVLKRGGRMVPATQFGYPSPLFPHSALAKVEPDILGAVRARPSD